jgi:hypothetical protein
LKPSKRHEQKRMHMLWKCLLKKKLKREMMRLWKDN